MSNAIPRRPGMTFEQRDKAIGMLTAGMSARDVARNFQRHESTICRLLNRFQQTGNRLRSGRPRKTTPREGRFLTSLSRRKRFLCSRKLGRLLRNATGTRVCHRTVRNRLHFYLRLVIFRKAYSARSTFSAYRIFLLSVVAIKTRRSFRRCTEYAWSLR